MNNTTCWTCSNFVYSGNGEIGFCTLHKINTLSKYLCKYHPCADKSDYFTITDELED